MMFPKRKNEDSKIIHHLKRLRQQKGRLKTVLTDWTLPVSTLYALYLSRHRLPLAVRSLLDFLAEQFEEEDW